MYSSILSWPNALERGEGSASRSGRYLPSGKTRYPLYRRLSGSKVGSGQVRKMSPPPVFDSRTVQPVASRYTDYATRPTENQYGIKFRKKNEPRFPHFVESCATRNNVQDNLQYSVTGFQWVTTAQMFRITCNTVLLDFSGLQQHRCSG
jgi:hypothetical protein